MPTPEEAAKSLRETLNNNREVGLRQSLGAAQTTSPDRYAEAVKIGQKIQVPAEIVEADLDGFKTAPDPETTGKLLREYPVLSDWMAAEDNAKLSHDDIGPLMELTDAFRSIGGAAVGDVYGRAFEGTGKAIQRFGEVTAEGMVRAGVENPDPVVIGLTHLFGEGLEMSGQGLRAAGEFIKPPAERRGFLDDVAGGVGQVGGQILLGPLAVPGMFGQGLSYGYESAERAGYSGTARADAAAFLYAAITGVTERYGLEWLLKGIPEPVKRKVTGRVADAIVKLGGKADGQAANVIVKAVDTAYRGVVEGSQEFAEGFFQNLVDIGILDEDKPLFEGTGQSAAVGGTVGTLVGGIINTMLKGKTDFNIERETSVHEEFKGIRERVAKSKTFARSPERVNKLLGATADQSVYLNPEAVQTFYQSADPEARRALDLSMPDFADRLTEAVTTGGDFVMSRADYVTYVQPVDASGSLDEYVRLEPEDLSVGDRALYDEMIAELSGAQDQQGLEAGSDVQQGFYNQLLGMLGTKTGPSSNPDVARLLAENLRAVYDTLSQRFEGNADETQAATILNRLLRDLRVRHIRKTVENVRGRGDFDLYLDKIRNREKRRRYQANKAPKVPKRDLLGVKPSRKKKSEKPKYTPLMDYFIGKGQIKMGSSAAADLRSYDITPKHFPKLFSKDGTVTAFDNVSLSDLQGELGSIMAPVASPTGGADTDAYYADRDWIVDTLNDEAFGRGQATEEEMLADAEAAQADEILQILDQYAGLDITDPEATNERVKAALDQYARELTEGIENPQDGTLYQNGVADTESEAFKKWFGDSKIVDENGKPLVVYKAMEGDVARISPETGMTHVALEKKVAEGFSLNGRPVQEVYVKAEKPFDFRNDADLQWILGEMSKPKNIKAFNKQTKAIMGDGYEFEADKGYIAAGLQEGAYQTYEVPVVSNLIRNRGYDAVYMVEEGEQYRQPNLAVFDPSQIKSVNNRGTFDQNDARILYQSGEYRGSHTAPMKDGNNTLDNAVDVYGEDIYDPSVSWRYYGHGGDSVAMDKESAKIIAQFKGKPDADVTIYRAVPEGVTEINAGDWVTINKNYAKSHGESHVYQVLTGGKEVKYHIIEKVVKAKELATDANSIHEWGYDPSLGKDRTLYQSAFHGSPFHFDKFTIDHIGAGEGNQAFGWGLYFAGKKSVAEYYRESLADRSDAHNRVKVNGVEIANGTPEHHAARLLYHNPKPEILKLAKEMLDDANKAEPYAVDTAKQSGLTADEYYGRLHEFVKSHSKKDVKMGKGQLYEVKIPEDEQLLQWHLPIEKQPPDIKRILKESGLWKELKENLSDFSSPQNTRGKLNGENIYAYLQWKLGSDKAASLRLNELGIPGMKYPSGTIANAKGGGFNYVIFDDSAIETIQTFYQGGNQDPRGAISFPQGEAVISLFEREDLSTVLHELGHLYNRALKELAALPNAPQQIRDDFDTLKTWVGWQEGQTDFTIEQEEKIADGFLAYLKKGEAPSVSLQSAFSRFKGWLTRLYAGIRESLLPSVDPEVSGVFDRLLATDAEIERLAKTPEFNIDKAILALLPKAEADRYIKKMERNIAEAKDRLFRKALRQAEKKNTKEYNDARAQVLAETTQMVEESQLQKAIEATIAAGGLNRKDLLDQYGAEIFKYLTPHGRGMVARTGGIDAQTMAGLTGYGTGRDLIHVLMNAQPKKVRIEAAVEEEMTRRYGDMLTNGTIEREAMEMYHSALRGEVLAMEMKILAQMGDIPAPSPEGIKAKAIQIMADTHVKDIQPERRLRAENSAYFKYGRELGRKNYAKAAKFKAQQLLNHHLYRMSLDAREEMESQLKSWRKLIKAKDENLSKTMDIDYAYAARAILVKYGVAGASTLQKWEKSFRLWEQQVLAEDPDGYEALAQAIAVYTDNVPAWTEKASKSYTNRRTGGLVSPVTRTPPFMNMAWNDFQGLADGVANITKAGRDQKEAEIEGKRVSREQINGELAAQIATKKKSGISSGFGSTLNDQDKRRMSLYGVKAMLRRVEFWCKDMDGGYAGPFHTYIWNPIQKALTSYRDARKIKLKELVELMEPFTDEMFGDKIIAPELISSKSGERYEFENLGEVLGMLQHVGNESNLYKLMVGMGWSRETEDGEIDYSPLRQFIDRLESDGILQKKHWDLIQKRWDMMEAMKPAIWKAHHDMYGYRPDEVTAAPVTTSFGTYRGGYWPAIADKNKTEDAAIRADRQVASESNMTAFPTTGRGATKKRTEQYAAPLEFGQRVMVKHLDWALRFIHIEPTLKQTAKIINDKTFRANLRELDPSAASEMLIPWLQRIGRQSIEPQVQGKGWQFLNSTASWIRLQAGLQTMMFNAVNILQQVTGFSQVMRQTGPRYFGRAFVQYVSHPNKESMAINDLSGVMRHAAGMFQDEDYAQKINRIIEARSTYKKVADFQSDIGYVGQKIFQNFINRIAWIAAYNKALDGKAQGIDAMNEAEAIRFADHVVSETQGFNNPENVSAIEAQSACGRLFLMFYSYFNNQGNLLVTEAKQVVNKDAPLAAKAGSAFYLYLMCYAIPSFLADLIGSAMRGSLPDDDDDDGWVLDDWFKFFLISQLRYGSAMLPYIGQVGNALIGRYTPAMYDDGISVSPAISVIERTLRAPFSLWNAMFKDGDKSLAVRDSLTAVGMAGIPAGIVNRPATYLTDVAEGDSDPDNVLEFGRGVLAGPAMKPEK